MNKQQNTKKINRKKYISVEKKNDRDFGIE